MSKKPKVLVMPQMQIDLDDVDGSLVMLEPKLAGFTSIMFDSQMDIQKTGRISVNGEAVACGKFFPYKFWGNAMYCFDGRKYFTEYGKEYHVHIEGFYDEDGNEMEPQELVFHYTPMGAGRINSRYAVRFLDGIRDFSSIKINERLTKFYQSRTDEVPDNVVMEEALQFSDTAVIVISCISGENVDVLPIKGEYYLTDAEEKLSGRERRIITGNFPGRTQF